MLKLILKLGSKVIADLSCDPSLQSVLPLLDAQGQTLSGVPLRKITLRKSIVGRNVCLVIKLIRAAKEDRIDLPLVVFDRRVTIVGGARLTVVKRKRAVQSHSLPRRSHHVETIDPGVKFARKMIPSHRVGGQTEGDRVGFGPVVRCLHLVGQKHSQPRCRAHIEPGSELPRLQVATKDEPGKSNVGPPARFIAEVIIIVFLLAIATCFQFLAHSK